MSQRADIEKDQNGVRRGHRSPRARLLILAGAVVIAGAAIYIRSSFSLLVGSGPAGPSVEAAKFNQPWTTRPVLLVGLGDSITAGFGARRGYGYFERLVTNPPDEFPPLRGCCLSAVFPRLIITNLAESGSVSAEIAEAQLPKLPMASRETMGFVVITTGGNDLIHNYGRTPPREHAMYGATLNQARPWIEHFQRRLEHIIAGTSNRFPGGCQIFLANLYDPTDGAGDIERAGLPKWPEGMAVMAAYNEVIRQCAVAHTNVHLVDLRNAFLGHGLHCGQFWSKHYDAKDPHYWYYTNLEDPNERGYDAVRRLFLNEMANVAPQLH